MGRYLPVNLLGPDPRLIKKEFTGPRSHKGSETLVFGIPHLPCQTVVMEVWGHILLCQDPNDVSRGVSEQPAFERACRVQTKLL